MTGTICVGLVITGSAGGGKHRLGAGGAVLMPLALPFRSFKCRIAAVAAAQTAGGSAVVKMKPGA